MSYAQLNDLKLVNLLMGQDINHLDSILYSTGYDYTITNVKGGERSSKFEYTIYIESISGGIKLWEVEANQPYRIVEGPDFGDIKEPIEDKSPLITKIYVRYRNSNVGDLRDFKSYEVPKNDSITYEKDLGKNLSHLKVEYKIRPKN